MTIKLILAAAALSGSAALHAATLSGSTAVQSQPDPSSAVITILKAGSEQPALSDKAGPAPAGWIAVEVSGPYEAYVKNRDLTKQLDVKPGAKVYLSPKEGTAVLATFDKGDKAEITGLHGSWTQIRLEKTLVGYIQTSAPATAPEPLPPPGASAPGAYVPPTAVPATAISAAPAAASPGDVSLSKLFEGTLSGTRSLLSPKKPYDWQLVDPDGKRIAFVDLSKLLIPDQIDNYTGHSVVVLGSLEAVKNSSDLVIRAEGLRLK